MGLTTTKVPGKVRQADVTTGKNYLTEEELQALKLIVEQYLAFAEVQVRAQRPMYMKDWIERLGLILTMNEYTILDHAGGLLMSSLSVRLKSSMPSTESMSVRLSVWRISVSLTEISRR